MTPLFVPRQRITHDGDHLAKTSESAVTRLKSETEPAAKHVLDVDRPLVGHAIEHLCAQVLVGSGEWQHKEGISFNGGQNLFEKGPVTRHEVIDLVF